MSRQRLLALEAQLEHRRRLNRRMIAPGRDPDSGEILATVSQTARQAQAHASAVLRAAMVLPPIPDLRGVLDEDEEEQPSPVRRGPRGPKRAEEPLGETASRVLDLLAHGARPRHVMAMTGLSRNTFDYIVREACKALGTRDRGAALEAWRARLDADRVITRSNSG